MPVTASVSCTQSAMFFLPTAAREKLCSTFVPMSRTKRDHRGSVSHTVRQAQEALGVEHDCASGRPGRVQVLSDRSDYDLALKEARDLTHLPPAVAVSRDMEREPKACRSIADEDHLGIGIINLTIERKAAASFMDDNHRALAAA